MLKFNNSWRYDSPGKIPNEIKNEFSEVIGKIARGEQSILEHFKQYFASASGTTASWSSNASWADTDLGNYMNLASDNAVLFIEAFYDACESLKSTDVPVPDVQTINKLLTKHNSIYKIDPPNLIVQSDYIEAPAVEIPISLDQNVQNIIQTSMGEGRKLLGEGRHRQAVQEVLWLLETVSTAFQGTGNEENSVQGKYFNKIVDELRRNNQGTALEQVIGWIAKLHGYLSAPAGGGIRHGMNLKTGIATTEGEARLYFNLITSYVSYLLSEYERISSNINYFG